MGFLSFVTLAISVSLKFIGVCKSSKNLASADGRRILCLVFFILFLISARISVYINIIYYYCYSYSKFLVVRVRSIGKLFNGTMSIYHYLYEFFLIHSFFLLLFFFFVLVVRGYFFALNSSGLNTGEEMNGVRKQVIVSASKATRRKVCEVFFSILRIY